MGLPWLHIVLCVVGLQVVHAGNQRPGSLRRLQQGNTGSGVDLDTCRLRALRILPTASLSDYDRCLMNKRGINSTHDWGVAGAEYDAWVDCWCSLNMSQAITDLGCCSHGAFEQWCNLECTADCSSSLATECKQECPPMCFEAQEYIIPRNLCSSCNPTKCFPVMKCLLEHSEDLTNTGELDRTCHEPDFERERDVRERYRQCWLDMPKHSSHWNVVSAWLHCACREGMVDLANRTDCCKSVTYAGGICDAHCPAERECASQEAQTCIHNCNTLCSSRTVAPTEQCKDQCLKVNSPCRKYLGCRTPMLTMSNYVCDDGQWPQASTGCCVSNSTAANFVNLSCPALCETKLIYRLDIAGVPWWATQSSSPVYQCTCDGCPAVSEEGTEEVRQTLEETIWDNGQDLLVDIARRESLKLGPNRQMQELMVRRNELVLEASAGLRTGNRQEVENRIQNINAYYTHLITEAARTYPDDGLGSGQINELRKREEENAGLSRVLAILLSITGVLVIVLLVVITVLIRRRRQQKSDSPVTAFAETDQVVIGSPVPANQTRSKGEGVISGAAVTVAAPTREKA